MGSTLSKKLKSNQKIDQQKIDQQKISDKLIFNKKKILHNIRNISLIEKLYPDDFILLYNNSDTLIKNQKEFMLLIFPETREKLFDLKYYDVLNQTTDGQILLLNNIDKIDQNIFNVIEELQKNNSGQNILFNSEHRKILLNDKSCEWLACYNDESCKLLLSSDKYRHMLNISDIGRKILFESDYKDLLLNDISCKWLLNYNDESKKLLLTSVNYRHLFLNNEENLNILYTNGYYDDIPYESKLYMLVINNIMIFTFKEIKKVIYENSKKNIIKLDFKLQLYFEDYSSGCDRNGLKKSKFYDIIYCNDGYSKRSNAYINADTYCDSLIQNIIIYSTDVKWDIYNIMNNYEKYRYYLISMIDAEKIEPTILMNNIENATFLYDHMLTGSKEIFLTCDIGKLVLSQKKQFDILFLNKDYDYIIQTNGGGNYLMDKGEQIQSYIFNYKKKIIDNTPIYLGQVV
jgi:hypothetical protein